MFGNASICAETLHHNRDLLMEKLSSLNVATIVFDYDGGGDSGDITEVAVTPAERKPLLSAENITVRRAVSNYRDGGFETEVTEVTSTLETALHDFALSWLELHHGGWENNDGGRGTVTINVAENSFELQHEEYYTDSNHYAYSL